MTQLPEAVVLKTIQGIAQDKLHVFPDAIAKNAHIFNRYALGLLDWINNKFTNKEKIAIGE